VFRSVDRGSRSCLRFSPPRGCSVKYGSCTSFCGVGRPRRERSLHFLGVTCHLAECKTSSHRWSTCIVPTITIITLPSSAFATTFATTLATTLTTALAGCRLLSPFSSVELDDARSVGLWSRLSRDQALVLQKGVRTMLAKVKTGRLRKRRNAAVLLQAAHRGIVARAAILVSFLASSWG
jgi:hypothetical protein